MKVILTQDVIHLGEEGDIVTVKDGYARNYLLPTGAAVVFNRTNEALFQQRAEAIAKRKAEKRAASASLKEKLDAVSLTIVLPAGDSGKLFGSVTAQMVQELLSKEGYEIEKKKLDVPTHSIKMTGEYSVVCHLYENDKSVVKLIVKSEAEVKEEARKAAKAAEEAAKAEAEAAAKAEAEAEAPAEAPVEG